MTAVGQSRGRFAAIPEWALRNPVLLSPPSNLVTYNAMCLLANYKDRTGEPDWEQINELTGQSRTVIYRCMGALKDAGIIVLREDGMYDLPLDEPCGKQSQSRDSEQSESQSRDSESQSRDGIVPIAGFAPLSTDTPESSSESPTSSEVPENLCAYLQRGVTHHLHRAPKLSTNWVRDMDLLLRRGPTSWAEPAEVAPEQIHTVIGLIYTRLTERGPDGFCWADVIQTPNKLRKHWDSILLAIERLGVQRRAAERKNPGGDLRELRASLEGK